MTGSPGRRVLRLVLAVAAGLLVVGCSMTLTIEPTSFPLTQTPTLTPLPTDTPVGEPLSQKDWLEYTLAEEGLALALPRSWHRVDLDDDPPAGVLRAQRLRQPGPAQVLPAGDPELRFFAYDLPPEGASSGFMANLNVVHRHLGAGGTLAEFGGANAREVSKMSELAAPVQEQHILLPAGPALRLRYELTFGVAEGQDNRLSLTQLLLVHGQEGYVLTFATMPAHAEHYAAIFDEIARSLRWLE